MELLVNEDLPELTKYETKCICNGLECSYVPALKSYFINSWEVSIGFPIAVSFIIISSYFVYLLLHTKIFALARSWPVIFLMTVLMLLFYVSYVAGILEGPGYLPFYYPFQMSEQGDNKYRLDGIVTTREQLFFIKNKPALHRAGYFKSANRIVIRPDHYCMWFATFIGKRNHKLFYLFNTWGFIYISFFFGFDIYATYLSVTRLDSIFRCVVLLIYIFLALFFWLMTLMFSCESFCQIGSNVTSFEKMKRKKGVFLNKKVNSCVESWEEICGPVSKWYIWPFPIPAFYGKDDYSLVNERDYDKML